MKKTLHRQAKQGDDHSSMYFTYLPEGWLLSETGKSSAKKKNFTRDYIWLGNKPIAQIESMFTKKGKVAKQRIYYLHTDHLNTPRVATNQKQKVVWRWDANAFGDGGLTRGNNQDNKLVKVRLRFPGQYYDNESQLFYNHHRDYDPSLGRYIQSDPIGLDGGLNRCVILLSIMILQGRFGFI